MNDRIADMAFTPPDEDLELPVDQPEPAQDAEPLLLTQRQIDPFAIAVAALGAATDAYNVLAQPANDPKTRQHRTDTRAIFERSVALAESAASLGHALVARDQLIIMTQQVQAVAQKVEVVRPGDIRIPRN